MQLTARPVTAPAARNHRPRAPGPSRPAPRAARLPALLRTGSPAQSVAVRSPALPAGAPVVGPAASPGISHGPRARSSPASSADRAVSAMAGARQARKHPAICQVTSSRPPRPAGLTSGLAASDGDSVAASRYARSRWSARTFDPWITGQLASRFGDLRPCRVWRWAIIRPGWGFFREDRLHQMANASSPLSSRLPKAVRGDCGRPDHPLVDRGCCGRGRVPARTNANYGAYAPVPWRHRSRAVLGRVTGSVHSPLQVWQQDFGPRVAR